MSNKESIFQQIGHLFQNNQGLPTNNIKGFSRSQTSSPKHTQILSQISFPSTKPSEFALFDSLTNSTNSEKEPLNESEFEEKILMMQDSSEKDDENIMTSNPELNFEVVSYSEIAISYQKYTKCYQNEKHLITFFRNHKETFYLKENQWRFNLKEYNHVLTMMRDEKIDEEYNVKKIPRFTQKALFDFNYTKLDFYNGDIDNEENVVIDYSNDQPKKLTDLPHKFYDKLYSFQKEGIQFALEHKCRLLFADEMGVGKTIQAIALCGLYKEDWPVLVICPGSIKYSWKSEIIKWLEIKNEHKVQVINSSNDTIYSKASFYIVSYDLVRRITKVIKKIGFNFVVLDECHCIKSIKTQRSQSIIPIAQKSKRLLLLSGTPLLARPSEGFAVLNCLRPDIFYSFGSYGRRYCNNGIKKQRSYFSGASNTKELNLIMNKIMIRRLKKNVLSQLPPKRRQRIEIDCDEKYIEKIVLLPNTMNQQYFANANEEEKVSTSDLYRLTALAKLNGICEYVKSLLDNEIKFILFAHHQIVLDKIEELAEERKVDYIRIDGTITGQKRFDMVQKFQTDPQCKIAILSITVACTGITLTEASMVVFAELTWTPALMIQAEDRAHRIGQEHQCVDVVYLYGKCTLDEYIFNKLGEKIKVVSKTLDDEIDKDFQEIVEQKEESNDISIDSSMEDAIYLSISEEEKEKELLGNSIVIEVEKVDSQMKHQLVIDEKSKEEKIKEAQKRLSTIYDVNLHTVNFKRVRLEEYQCEEKNVDSKVPMLTSM